MLGIPQNQLGQYFYKLAAKRRADLQHETLSHVWERIRGLTGRVFTNQDEDKQPSIAKAILHLEKCLAHEKDKARKNCALYKRNRHIALHQALNDLRYLQTMQAN